MGSSSSTAAAMSSSSPSQSPSPSPSPSYYLLKSEPDDYSITQLQTDRTAEWDGVRNYAARNHLRSMKVGDRCFFYHSSCKVPAIVGICTVARTAQPDPTFEENSNKENPWVSVLVEFESLWGGGDGADNNDDDDKNNHNNRKHDETNYDPQVTLKELKNQALSNPIIANMTLLKMSRLSVMPVSSEEWNAVHDLKERKKIGEDLLLVAATAAAEEETTTTTRQVKTARKRPRGSPSTTNVASTTAACSKNDDAGSVDDDNSDVSSSRGGSKKTSKNSQKKKKKKNDKKVKTVSTPTSTANAADTNVDDPGYCSIPSEALSDSQIQFILSSSSSSSSSEYQDTDEKKKKKRTRITEKELGLSGRKFLYKIDVASDGENDSMSTKTLMLVFYYDGTKFIGKDKKRLDAMLDAVRSNGNTTTTTMTTSDNADERTVTAKVYLLLSASSGICRRNTLPALLKDGVIVQRVQE